MQQLFKAEMVAELASTSAKKCRCGERLQLIRTILDKDTGELIHMFECSCGERTWTD